MTCFSGKEIMQCHFNGRVAMIFGAILGENGLRLLVDDTMSSGACLSGNKTYSAHRRPLWIRYQFRTKHRNHRERLQQERPQQLLRGIDGRPTRA